MKARNKQEREVEVLNSTLPKVTKRQFEWAKENCFDHIAYVLKSGKATCMDCGGEWKLNSEANKCVCPHCGRKLKVERTLKRTYAYNMYMGIFTTYKDYQVMRFFFVKMNSVKGEKANYDIVEVVRQWIREDGKVFNVARNRQMSMWYYDSWNECSSLSLKKSNSLYYMNPEFVYPTRKYINQLTRNGFKGNFYGLNPTSLLSSLLANPIAETLMKMNKIDLLSHFQSSGYPSKDIWSALKLCFRKDYKIEKVALWCDYINMMIRLGYDIKNEKYACPRDLHIAHDQGLKKIRKIEKMEEEKRAFLELQKNLEKQTQYEEEKGKFFDLSFTKGDLEITPLKSVQEFYDEGKAMHHCVYSLSYYTKKGSLIFSAKINGKRIETIEVSLQDGKVLQSYGVCNKFTEHHETILKVMSDNRLSILKRVS